MTYQLTPHRFLPVCPEPWLVWPHIIMQVYRSFLETPVGGEGQWEGRCRMMCELGHQSAHGCRWIDVGSGLRLIGGEKGDVEIVLCLFACLLACSFVGGA